MSTRHPKRRAGNMQYGAYLPPTPEQNIRSFERFPVSRENLVLVYKPYDRLGYGEESKVSIENSINEFKKIAKLNRENPFTWMPIRGIPSSGGISESPFTIFTDTFLADIGVDDLVFIETIKAGEQSAQNGAASVWPYVVPL